MQTMFRNKHISLSTAVKVLTNVKATGVHFVACQCLSLTTSLSFIMCVYMHVIPAYVYECEYVCVRVCMFFDVSETSVAIRPIFIIFFASISFCVTVSSALDLTARTKNIEL